MRHLPKTFFLVLFYLVFAFSVSAQEAQQLGKVEDFRFDSRMMAREMPYRVIFPPDYDEGRKEKSYPVIYLLHGLTGHYNNWTDRTKIAEYASRHGLFIIMPEGNDGWYSDSASVSADKYETYFIEEFIPAIDRKFRTVSGRNGRMIAGLSMGGYGSLKFGLKYPERFVMVGSFSGALGAASWTEKTLGTGWKALTDSIISVYGPEGSSTREKNDIYKIVRELTPERVAALPYIYLDCGTEDFLIQQNRDFNLLLAEKKIPHEYRELPGKHDWTFWDSQVQEFLRLAARRLKIVEAVRNSPIKTE
jgi:putative tributyrin esterase